MGEHEQSTIGVGRVRGRRRVTMTDVARAANCSQSTVSFVLNNNRAVQISDSTRKRVLKVADELGYEGTKPAKTGEGEAAAIVFGFLIDSFAVGWEGGTALLEGVRQRAWPQGALVLATETENDERVEPAAIRQVIAARAEMIVYACVHTREVTLPPLLREVKTPVFLLNCYTSDNARPAVVPSEIAGGQRATQALIDAGHRRIGTVTGESYMEASHDRLEGYRRALATADIPFEPALVKGGDWSASSGFNGTKALLQEAHPPTAIFCQNDRMAVGCYEALKEVGCRIPDDVSVVGYDDDEIARHLYPPLTTMILPHRAMGTLGGG
ncbi:MAG: LacI family DNA-binding transcriptional regulator [Pseudomonadota bacterium]